MKFNELALDKRLLEEIERQGFTELTPIQEKCLPLVLEGLDVIGQSETGSGKTFAFGLPLLQKIKPGKGVQALILTPTRELCVQISQVLHDFGLPLGLRVTSVYGGASFAPQFEGLRRSEIIVGTPGRVMDHLNQRTADFTKVNFFVLDEADKMLEMGFIEVVEDIIHYLPKERQTVLFSATMPSEIIRISERYMHSPEVVQTRTYVDKSLMHQVYYDVPQREKFSLLVYLLKQKTKGLALVFCATRQEVDIVARNLRKQRVEVMAIHGGLSQNKRLNALDSLREEKIDVLVATDVAARGLDIKNVSHVYNYDVPKTSGEYVHRIGRTARAGEEGDAVTLLSERDHENFRHVLKDYSLQIELAPLPEFERVPFQRYQEERHGSSVHIFHGRGYGGRGAGRRGEYHRSSSGRNYGRERSNSDTRRTSGYSR